MAADERLRALKIAYADIILNTAKEAAARIMASESKAQRFQRELQVAKEEALRMLLRLKHMMDSKITDAELQSLSQQKKIDELEAQLQEAEEIVKDLREELRGVHSELELVKNSKQKVLDDQHALAQRGVSEENEIHYSQSIALPPNQFEFGYVVDADLGDLHQFQKNESSKFSSGGRYMGSSYLGCPDLPSIILRSKEPELYRNGCTQRIRALEGNLLNRTFSGEVHKRKDEMSAEEGTVGKDIVLVPNCSAGNLSNLEKKVSEADSQLGPVPSFCVRKKRATRNRKKTIITSSKSFHDQLSRTDQALDVSCVANHLISERSDLHTVENESKMASRLLSDEAEPGLKAGSLEASEIDTEPVNSAVVHDCANGNEVTEKLVLMVEDPARSSVVTVGETDNQNLNSSLQIFGPSESAVSEGIHSRPIHERIIKYTFQRKRKKESLSESNGAVSLESDTSKREKSEKQNYLGEQKSNLVAKSQECQRLAQVAHQLISLSENKWWL